MNTLPRFLAAAMLLSISCAALAQPATDWQAIPNQAAADEDKFAAELKMFETEPVNPFNAADGADTCITVVTTDRGAKNVRWFSNRRLVATKGGKMRVLWDGKHDEFDSKIFEGAPSTMSTGYRRDSFLFRLRGVPVADGEITFEWGALAQPSKEEVAWGDDKLVSPEEMDEAAKNGGVRLSRKIVLRKDGEAISKPKFAEKPPLHVLDAELRPLEKPDASGMDTRVVLRMAYEGDEAEPKIEAPEGLELRDADKPRRDDDENERIPRSYTDTAQREAGTKIYQLEASAKKADLKNVRFLSIEARVSDGKSWPVILKAGLDLQHAPK